MLVLIHSKHTVIQSQTLLKNSSQIYEWIEKNKKHNKIVASKFVRSRLFCTWKTEGKEMEKPTLSHSIINTTSHNVYSPCFIFHVIYWFIFDFSSSCLDSTSTIAERFSIPKFYLLSLLSRFDLKQEFRVDRNTGRVFPHNCQPSVENENMFKYIPFFFISIN